MNLSLETPHRRQSMKFLAIGNYIVLGLDIIAGLAFVPLYLHYFGDRLYGLWLGTGGIIAALGFLDMGMASLSIQRVSKAYSKKDYRAIGAYFSNGLLVHLLLMAILLLAGLLVSFNLRSIFSLSAVEAKVLIPAMGVAVVALSMGLLNNTVEGTLNALQKSFFGKASLILSSLTGLIITYLMIISGMGVIAIPCGLFARSLLALLPNFFILMLILKKNGIPILCIDRTIIRDFLSLSPSMFLSKLGTNLVSNIEPTLITIFVSPETAVFFSVTKKAGNLVRTFINRIGGILYPSLAHLHESSDKFRRTVIDVLYIVVPISLVGFLLYVLINKVFITLWVGPDNYLGDAMTALIGISLLWSYYSNLTSYLLATTGDIKWPSIAIFFESILKLGMLYLLLKLYGVYGLPIATLITSMLFTVLYARRWGMHLNFGMVQWKSTAAELYNRTKWIIVTAGLGFILARSPAIANPLYQVSLYGAISVLFGMIIIRQNRSIHNLLFGRFLMRDRTSHTT